MSVPWLDPRNGPEFDLPMVDQPRTRLLLATTPRCGSTLLARLLWETGSFGAPKEYLNPMQLWDWGQRFGHPAWRALLRVAPPSMAPVLARGWTTRAVLAHLARVEARRTSANGVFGLKLHAHHAHHWFGTRLPGVLDKARVVRLVREDSLAQAISWVRAEQTGAWVAHQPVQRQPRYRRRAITRKLDAIAWGDAWWAERARTQQWTVLRVTYDALVASPVEVLERIAAHVGVTLEGPMPTSGLVRQADATSLAWKQRYLDGQ